MAKKRAADNRKQLNVDLHNSLQQEKSSGASFKNVEIKSKIRRKSEPESQYTMIKYLAFGIIFLTGVFAASWIYNVEAAEIGGYISDKGLKVLVKLGIIHTNNIPAPIIVDEKPEFATPPAAVKYKKADITSQSDNKIRSMLDEADTALEKNRVDQAIKLYSDLKLRYPESPRAVYGKANALNKQSELKRSNQFLEEAIEEYLKVLSMKDIPKQLFLEAGRLCAERQAFRGWGYKATQTLKQILSVYPDELGVWNQLGIQHLMIGRNEDARQAFTQVLQKDPQNGVAMVHMGFIVKTADKNYEGSIPYFEKGLATNQEGVIDGRFFFHLGDALFRLGKHGRSYEVYKAGADKGVFMSMWQRSLYNVPGLTSRPWWTLDQTGKSSALKILEKNWKTIRDEGLANLDEKSGVFKPEDEDLRETGDWKQFTLFQQGKKNEQNCNRAPKTCALVEKIPEAAKCTRGQIKFSVMHPGVHVWPHCGPTNCRIRCHLGLVTPDGPRIRVGNETNTWKEGEIIIFDDSFEHEVWHEGTSMRLVLIMDMWHPELSMEHRTTLPPI